MPRPALVGLMSALAVALSYATSWVPNFNPMDLVVFCSGAVGGASSGVLVGVLSWSVYGVLNPYGFVPPILAATAVSEAVYGLAGAALKGERRPLPLAAAGLVCTAVYDLATNLAYSLVFGVDPAIAILAGAPFAAVHEGSNAILFSVAGPRLLSVLEKLGKADGPA